MKVQRPVYAIQCADTGPCGGPRPCYGNSWKDLVTCLV